MKIKKILGLALVGVTAASVMAFSGCEMLNSILGGGDDSSSTTPGGQKEFVLEAENTDMIEVAGAGISNNNSGSNMILGGGEQGTITGASNGAFVGNTHSNATEITFAFNADKAANATVVLMLGSELGDIDVSDSDVTILLNGEEVYHNMWSIDGSSNEAPEFTRCVLGQVSLVAGANTIVLKVNDNTLKSGSTGGPNVDCIKITTSAALTWTDYFEANIADREGI